MNKLKLFFPTLLTIILCFSCSSESEPSGEGEQMVGCTKTCDAGFVLNEDTCECEEEPCTKTCDAGFTLNEDTCECEADPFVANIIEVETETATLVGDWKLKTDITGYSSDGYIVWEGADQYWKGDANIGKVGKITFDVEIPRAGVYLFQWRSYIAKKAATDAWAEHNDSWLRALDVADFYAEKPGSIIYPKGTGKSPNPAGENGNGFFKIYMNTLDEWSWISSTSDSNAHQIYIKFDEAKTYVVEIAPRSSFHAIDKFKLTEQDPNG